MNCQVNEGRSHPPTLACLQTCTEWVLDVYECKIDEHYGQDGRYQPQQEDMATLMKAETTMKLMTVRNPQVKHHRCNLGDPFNQADAFDELLQEDRYSAEVAAVKDLVVEEKENVQPELERLASMPPVSFPIKNKSRQQNMHITNFQFEQDKSLKQETFLLAFDTKLADQNAKPLEVTDGMTGRQFLFKI